MRTIEDIDLARLAKTLRDRLPAGEPKGYLRGRSALRDLVESVLGCSVLESEELVDTLESRGYLQYLGNPSERSYATATWDINPSAEL